MNERSKPHLTEDQQRRVERARQVITTDPQAMVAEEDPIGGLAEVYGYAFGVAKANIEILLSVIAELAEVAPAATAQAEVDPGLYVVVEADRASGGPVTVTDPKPKAEAEQWARDNRYSFAGWLEVRPATQADLDDADSGPVAKPVTYACTGCDWHSGRDWDPAEKCPLCGSDIAADLNGEA